MENISGGCVMPITCLKCRLLFRKLKVLTFPSLRIAKSVLLVHNNPETLRYHNSSVYQFNMKNYDKIYVPQIGLAVKLLVNCLIFIQGEPLGEYFKCPSFLVKYEV